MRKLLLLLVCVTMLNQWSWANNPPAYLNESLTLQERVEDLISRMTLEEKVSQMKYNAPAIERLDVPSYNWWNECLHGVGRAGVATVFPQAIGFSATWNTDLIHQSAMAISDEARAKHHNFVSMGLRDIYMGLTYWTPNINIFRDPRWGRGQETYGEDPFLTSRMAVNFIEGLQGDDDQHLKLVATAKHFAVHSGPESTRHSINVKISDQDLYETYLPAFKATVQEAHVQSIMCAYNRLDGQPCCGSENLLQQILRKDWGFKGYVVSDCWALVDFYEEDKHYVVKSGSEAAAMAVKAGTELNCGQTYEQYLLEAVKEGKLTEEEIDKSLYTLFESRFLLGMFDNPENVKYAQIPYSVVASEPHKKLARQASQEAIVLLKNDGILPFKKDIKSLAIIGPNADEYQVLYGNYHGTATHMSTPLEGIRKKAGDDITIYHAEGCRYSEEIPSFKPIPSNFLFPENRDAVVKGLAAKYYANLKFEGTPAFERIDAVVDFTWKDKTPVTGKLNDKFGVVWTGYLKTDVTGTYKIGLNACNAGKLFIDGVEIVSFDHEHHTSQITKDMEMQAGRFYKVRIEMYSYGSDPQIHLVWARPDDNFESEAMEAAKYADAVVMFMGLTPHLEGEEMPVKVDGFVGGDRTKLQLPKIQQDLIRKVQALGKPVVLVLMGGSALAINWEHENLNAILDAWYPGEFGGDAIADILFGDVNPSGKLPVTFYKSVEDLPDFENYDMEGRTYRYFKGTPLYPFGYGLSYSDFQYGKIKASSKSIKGSQKIKLTTTLTNAGKVAGQEVIQLYISKENRSETEPLRTLKSFKKISLAPGESKEVSFEISADDLALANADGAFETADGAYTISIGGGQPIELPHLKTNNYTSITLNYSK